MIPPLSASECTLTVPCALVGALTKALCCKYARHQRMFCNSSKITDVNRITTTPVTVKGSQAVPPQVDPRILILSVSPDQSTSYISIMNSIFSAQKLVCAPNFHSSWP
jgi:transcription initiation factor TFIIH subunit 3